MTGEELATGENARLPIVAPSGRNSPTPTKELSMSNFQTSNEKKVVVITGASSGIGETAALALAQAGHTVVLGARRQQRLEILAEKIRALGGTVAFLATDVIRKEQVDALIGLARERFGRVDVIVNNAGVMPLSALEELKLDEWERMVDVLYVQFPRACARNNWVAIFVSPLFPLV